jgi:hydrogenase nickel incorporation protein HypA/HybF
MHEMSIARAIYRQITSIEEKHQRCAVACAVEVGPLSGVEALLLQSAFADLSSESMRQVGLSIQEVPLEVRCLACHVESAIDSFRFVCPACGSPQVQVIRGDQVQLVHVDLV